MSLLLLGILKVLTVCLLWCLVSIPLALLFGQVIRAANPHGEDQ